MNNVTPIRKEDIPCKIQLITVHRDGDTTQQVHFRTDPTNNDGYTGCNPLGVYFDKEGKEKIRNTLIKQGKYTKLFVNDEGDIIYEIIVTVCPKNERYKEEK